MPRTGRGRLRTEVLANSLVASARRVEPGKKSHAKAGEWQPAAWNMFDSVPELHYAATWVGNLLSRAKLQVMNADGLVTEGPAVDALNDLFGGPDGQSEMLRQAGIHMTIAGEGYLVGRSGRDGDEWDVIAATQVSFGATGEIKIKGYDDPVAEPAPSSTLVIRFWRSHPQFPNRSDSATRPLLPVLGQIIRLTQMISSQADSRLAGAGIFAIPSEFRFGGQSRDQVEGSKSSDDIDQFIDNLLEVAAEGIRDPESPAAQVPIVVQGPAEYLDKLKHITFWSELDQHAGELRNEAIRRVALGLDMPPEVLTGTADVNHWGAWQIEEAAIKSHTEPLLELLTSAITAEYLRPVLESTDLDPEEFWVDADVTEMKLRPNRSREAVELWDRGELSGAALRRENGFDDTDAMAEDERKQWIVRKLAQGSPSPELVSEAARMLGLDFQIPSEIGDAARGERPLPRSLEEHPSQDVPDRAAANQLDLICASAEPLVLRALERAGNRLRSTGSDIQGIPAKTPAMDRYQFVSLTRKGIDQVLEDAWSTIDRVTLPIPANELEPHLDNYARMLISNRQPHESRNLKRYLSSVLA